jgi:hypothetical protein
VLNGEIDRLVGLFYCTLNMSNGRVEFAAQNWRWESKTAAGNGCWVDLE